MNTLTPLLLYLCCIATQWTAAAAAHAASKAAAADKGYVLYAMAPQDRGSYFVNEKGSGRYNYGYNTGDGIAKVEVSQQDGSIVGSYRYFDPNGKQVVRSYIADKKGFRVLGNDLPISPDTPVSHLGGLPALTGAVEGTEAFKIPPPLTHTTDHLRTHHLLKEQRLSQLQQTQYQQQQDDLEALRRRIKELEALQRDLTDSYSATRYYTTHYTPNLSVRNHLTHSYTSPYQYFRRDMNYDFPAGFAYTGLPTITERRYETTYPQSTYIIGRAR